MYLKSHKFISTRISSPADISPTLTFLFAIRRWWLTHLWAPIYKAAPSCSSLMHSLCGSYPSTICICRNVQAHSLELLSTRNLVLFQFWVASPSDSLCRTIVWVDDMHFQSPTYRFAIAFCRLLLLLTKPWFFNFVLQSYRWLVVNSIFVRYKIVAALESITHMIPTAF